MNAMLAYPLNFIIDGQPMSKKRHWTPLCGRGRPRIVLSAKYRAWEKGAVDQLWVQRMQYMASMVGPWEAIDTYIAVAFEFFMKDKRRYDLSNLIQGAEDALVKAEVIKDDSLIASYDGSRKHLGCIAPRVLIKITPYKGG